MYGNGQRRLRIPIYFARGINSGTIMDSTGGNLAPQFHLTWPVFLRRLKRRAFSKWRSDFFRQASNDPTSWTTFSDDYFQENWSVIQNLRPIIVSSGTPYHLDLQNEGIPPAGYDALLQYDQMLWNDYVAAYGSNDTLGFSIIADAAHVGQVSTVYGPSLYGSSGSPQLFDVHIYDLTGAEFGIAFNSLNAQGYQGVPWIIGEAYYNDPTEAAALRHRPITRVRRSYT